MIKLRIVFVVLLCVLTLTSFTQLNVTLSGGGIRAFKHIGVLKLLTDSNVKVDNIGGSSMGGLMAAFYASGYTIQETIHILSSQEGEAVANGLFFNQDRIPFYELENYEDFVNVSISDFSILLNNTPFNLHSSIPAKFFLLKYFNSINVHIKQNYDSLLIPLRLTASEVQSRKLYVFSQGDLIDRLRASVSFPIYFKAVRLQDSLMFLDGGLYNNLPIENMIKEFKPKKLIASSVPFDFPKAKIENIVSQVVSLVTRDFNYTLPDTIQGTVIKHTFQGVKTFDFEKATEIIDEGIKAIPSYIKEIKNLNVFNTSVNFEQRRIEFVKKSRFKVLYNKIEFDPDITPNLYVLKLLTPRKKSWGIEDFEQRYIRIFLDKRFNDIEFTPKYDYKDSIGQIVITDVKLKKLTLLSNITSLVGSPGNLFQIQIGASYNFFIKRFLFSNELLSNFGNFKLQIANNLRMDIAGSFLSHVLLKIYYLRHDFFSWQSSLLKEINPDFLITNRLGQELTYNILTSNNSYFTLGFENFRIANSYYLNDQIKFNGDSTDQSVVQGNILFTRFMYNTLNSKHFPTKGFMFTIKASFLQNNFSFIYQQTSTSRAVSVLNGTFRTKNIVLESVIEGYSPILPHLKIGFNISATYSNMQNIQDYYSTLTSMPYYSVLPEFYPIYMSFLSSNSFIGASAKVILNPFKKTDLFYLVFQSFHFLKDKSIEKNPQVPYSFLVSNNKNILMQLKSNFILSSSLVFNNKYLPVSFTINYLPNSFQNISLYLSVGYFFGNGKRALF